MGKHYCIWVFGGLKKNAAARRETGVEPRTCTGIKRHNWGTDRKPGIEAEGRSWQHWAIARRMQRCLIPFSGKVLSLCHCLSGAPTLTHPLSSRNKGALNFMSASSDASETRLWNQTVQIQIMRSFHCLTSQVLNKFINFCGIIFNLHWFFFHSCSTQLSSGIEEEPLESYQLKVVSHKFLTEVEIQSLWIFTQVPCMCQSKFFLVREQPVKKNLCTIPKAWSQYFINISFHDILYLDLC